MTLWQGEEYESNRLFPLACTIMAVIYPCEIRSTKDDQRKGVVAAMEGLLLRAVGVVDVVQ